MPRRPTFHIETFGCQMNVNDSEKVAGLLVADGYSPAAEAAEADFVFVNTCAVREKASEKLDHALARLRHLQRGRPELRIGVGGCVAQLQGTAILERAPQVDVLVGTHNFTRVPELLRRARETGERPVDLDRSADSFQVPPAAVAHTSAARAYVTVMEGCNHVCSFCVVPRTRGTEVCRAPEGVVEEVRAVVAHGRREVMLLGQTVNAYRHGKVDFVSLLERVDAVPGLERLRFTTSHPEHVDARFADAFARLERLCPYLHLPAQSGSDRILAAMRRGYTRAQYLETLALLRDRRSDLALSGDIIVGYPGESHEDFEATLSLVAAARYDALFTFTYSPRPGTSAHRAADDVPEEEKLRRLHELNALQQRFQAERLAARVGRREAVLVDTVAGENRVAGRTLDFKIVHFDAPGQLLGRTVDVLITSSGANSLQGQLLASDSLTESSAVPIL
jgi:tRNA-2-methylthio-N6-dimethylallyladenosine synthase